MITRRIYHGVVAAALCYTQVNGFNIAPTAYVGLQAQGVDKPVFTPAPSIEVFHKRQAGKNNPTCGWIDGNGASAVSCGFDYYCATQQSFVGCCSKTNCPGIVTTCYDILGKDICNASCQRFVGNLVCGSTLPYCATYKYEGNSVGYGCAAATGFQVTVALSVLTSDGGPLSIPTTSSSTSTTSSITVQIPVPTSTAPAAKKDEIGSGVIAGIVIGSVIALLLAGMLVFWIYKSRRKHREEREREAFYHSTQGLGLQDMGGWRASRRSTLPGDYAYNKVDFPTGSSPPLDRGATSPVSMNGSDYTNTLRNSSALGYFGPTMPEMAGDSGTEAHGQTRNSRLAR